MVLPAGRGPRQGDAYSQAKQVKERLKRWGKGEYRQLWEEAVKMTKIPPKAKGRRRTGVPEETVKKQQDKNGERATKLAQEGQFSRAVQTLTSQGMADATETTTEAMREKHPQKDPIEVPLSKTTVPQLKFTQIDVFNATKSFRQGSAPGPSGLRPEHLKVAVKTSSPDRANKALQGLS